jgi:hypothetical protein
VAITGFEIAASLTSPIGEPLAEICGVDADGLNAISLVIIQSAIEVHRHLGAGLLESVYAKCLIHYKKAALDGMYRIDLLVDDEVIVELKRGSIGFDQQSQRPCVIALKVQGQVEVPASLRRCVEDLPELNRVLCVPAPLR